MFYLMSECSLIFISETLALNKSIEKSYKRTKKKFQKGRYSVSTCSSGSYIDDQGTKLFQYCCPSKVLFV